MRKVAGIRDVPPVFPIMVSKVLTTVVLSSLFLAGCAGKQQLEGGASLRTSYLPVPSVTKPKNADDPVALEPAAWMRPGNPLAFAGRTVIVTPGEPIKLRPKEVALTFDDGPVPGKTPRILATLDDFKVKATFLMVGEMAAHHPEIAREVAEHGHTIGSHTFDHKNLASISFDAAMADVTRGEKAVAKATGTEPGIFRFPYLSDSRRLRGAIAAKGSFVIDVNVDSNDYFRSSPAEVAARTLSALRKNGGGIILMHDIHARTAAMLPALLTQMKAEGYKIVTLKPKREARSFLIASAE